MQEIARTCGLNTKTILQNWNLIAPKIKDTDIEASMKAINGLIDTYGDTWQTHLDELDLKTEIDLKEKPNWWSELNSRVQSILSSNPLKAVVDIVTGTMSGINSAGGDSTGSGSSGGFLQWRATYSLFSFAQPRLWEEWVMEDKGRRVESGLIRKSA